MEAVDKSLMDMYNVKDYDVSNQFKGDSSLPRQSFSSGSPEAKKKRLETESYYFQVQIRNPVIVVENLFMMRQLLEKVSF